MKKAKNNQRIIYIFLATIFLTMVFIGSAVINPLHSSNGEIIPAQLKIQTNECPYNIVWEKQWNNSDFDLGNGVIVDLAGDIWCAGSTGDTLALEDQLLLKYNSSGSLFVEKTYGGAGWDEAWDIGINSQGNIYMCGFRTMGAGIINATVFKLFPNGSIAQVIMWGYGGESYGMGIAFDDYDNIYLVGKTDNFSVGHSDIFVAKFDSAGNLLWNTTWGTSDYDYGNNIVVDSNNNSYVIGTFGFGVNTNATLTKLDANGMIDWMKLLGDKNKKDLGMDIDIDGTAIYVTGYGETWGAVDDQNLFIAKYDLAGNQDWLETWAGSGGSYDRGESIEVTPNHELLVTGYTNGTGVGKEDMLLLKFNSTGALLWEDTFGTTENDWGTDTISVSDNVFYTVGFTDSSGTYETWLMKFSVENVTPWATLISPQTDPASYDYNSPANLTFVLYDDIGGGIYRITSNGTFNQGWTPWTTSNNSQEIVIIPTTSSGTWLYTIEYNDTANNAGTPLIITIVVKPKPPSGGIPGFLWPIALLSISIVLIMSALQERTDKKFCI
ncbi:MAG: hypothetical protein ACTSRC_12485 [Candidatus Helarchaeota archaeon]